MLTFAATPERPLSFIVPPGTRMVKLVTIADVPAVADPLFAPASRVEVTWVDPGGQDLGARQLVLRAPPALDQAPGLGGALPDVLAPRSTVLHLPEPADQVREVRVSVPPDGPPVRVRAFRDAPAAVSPDPAASGVEAPGSPSASPRAPRMARVAIGTRSPVSAMASKAP